MAVRIALAGNPNSGKTTLFNALTGANQFVGNWPGVTVEKKEGRLKKHGDVTVTDLPGIYSLSPYTPEEVVARNYLLDERPDVIVNIVDGTNLERNLYLTTQLAELGVPLVVAVNMMDVVRRRGDQIDTAALAEALGCRVLEISALKGDGVPAVAGAALDAAREARAVPSCVFSAPVERALAQIEEIAAHRLPAGQRRWYAVKLFERDGRAFARLGMDADDPRIGQAIQQVEEERDDDAESIITNERYDAIAALLKGRCRKKNAGGLTASDKIDRIVTNRFLALPLFAAIMWAVYTLSIGTIGDWTVGFVNDVLFGEWMIPGAAAGLEAIGCADWLVSLVADGIIGGVGAVLGFVPQMLILFVLLAILEDVGYMARAAFIMDRVFRRFGLSGKSFIPMLISSGCGVPGVMASRTIEQDRDRKMTIMTTCFIPCGAKMPIVGLIAGALFGGSAWVATSAYFIGAAAVVVSGIILKKTRPFAGDPAPFVMELPAWHAPVPVNVLRATGERGGSFIRRAGTVILAASVMIWILNSLTFEGGLHYIGGGEEPSVLREMGEALAVVFTPLGFGRWQTAVATVLGLVAKEEVVGVFGALSSMASSDLAFEAVEAGEWTRLAVIGGEFFGGSGLAAYSFLIFNLLCAPCFAAMGAIRREMNSAAWTWAAIGYMCGFAYAVSLMVYQLGGWIAGNGFTPWTAAALAVMAALVYLLVRKNPHHRAALSAGAVHAAGKGGSQ